MAYQQYPPQPGYPQRPQKRHNPVVIGCASIFGVVVALIVIGAVISAATKKTPDASTAAPPVVSATSTQPAAKAKQTKPAAPAQPVTVLTEHGNGIKSTASFSVHGDWDLAYSFDCSNFGSQGNFAVTINSAGDVLVNELAAKGSDTTHQHDGPGKIALDVNSECAWTIKVVQLPG